MTAHYYAPTAHALKFRIGKEYVKFQNNVFKTDNTDLEALIDEQLKTNKGLKRLVRKLDRSAAEEKVTAHQELMRQQRGTLKGGVTGDAVGAARAPLTVEEQLRQTGVDVDQLRDAAEKDNLVLTENVDTGVPNVVVPPAVAPATAALPIVTPPATPTAVAQAFTPPKPA